MMDESAKKKQPGTGRLFVHGYLPVVILPVVAVMLCATLTGWSFFIAMLSDSAFVAIDALLVLLIITLFTGLLLSLWLYSLKQFDFLMKREHGIQQERWRTAKLKNRDMSHLELNETDAEAFNLTNHQDAKQKQSHL